MEYTPEMSEYLQALRDLRQAVYELRVQVQQTERAMDNVLNKSHLRSTLTLLNEYITVRRMLDIQHDKPSRL